MPEVSQHNSDPWHISGTDFPTQASLREKIIFLLQFAILAPSTHNSQPWTFNVGDSWCSLCIDEQRALREADPSKRDLFLSLGAFLEHLRSLGKSLGMLESIDYMSKNCVATVYFKNTHFQNIPEEFLTITKAIVNRINARGVFEEKKLPEELLERLSNLEIEEGYGVRFVIDATGRIAIADLTKYAIRMFQKRSPFRRELAGWLRFHNGKRGDGFAVIPRPFSYLLPLVVRMFDMGGVLSILNKKTILSAPVLCIIGSADDDTSAWLRTGMLLERIFLIASGYGVRHSIFAAAVEDEGSRKELKEMFTLAMWPQLVFALGYSSAKADHTPRISVGEKLMHK